MPKPLRKADVVPDLVPSNEKAPVSEKRPKARERLETEFEVGETLRKWETGAIKDIYAASAPALEYVKREGEEEIAAELEESQRRAVADVLAARGESTHEAAKVFELVPQKPVPPPSPWQSPEAFTVEPLGDLIVPSKNFHPGDSAAAARAKGAEHKRLKETLEDKRQALKELQRISAARQTEADRIRIQLLENEIEAREKSLERDSKEAEVEGMKQELSEKEESLLDLLNRKPLAANDIDFTSIKDPVTRFRKMVKMGMLSAPEREIGKQLIDRATELRRTLDGDVVALAGLAAGIVGAEKAIAELTPRLERAISTEARSKTIVEQQRAAADGERRTREAREADNAESKARRKAEKEREEAVQKTLGVTTTVLGLGLGGAFYAIGKAFSWFGTALKSLAEDGLWKSLGKVWKWIEKKVGDDTRDTKKA